MSTSSIGTSGRSAGTLVVTRRPARPLLMRPSAAPMISSSGCHSLLQLHRARLQARHVQQVAHQPVQPLGLSCDRFQQLAPRAGRRARAVLEERAGRAGDHGQRRAQVVRDRAQQRVAQPLGLDADLRAAAPPRRAARARARARSGWRRSRAGAGAPARPCAWRSAGRTPSTPTGPRRARQRHVAARRRPAACRCRAPPAGRARRPSGRRRARSRPPRTAAPGRRASGCRRRRAGGRPPGCRTPRSTCRTATCSSASDAARRRRARGSSRRARRSAARGRAPPRPARGCGP